MLSLSQTDVLSAIAKIILKITEERSQTCGNAMCFTMPFIHTSLTLSEWAHKARTMSQICDLSLFFYSPDPCCVIGSNAFQIHYKCHQYWNREICLLSHKPFSPFAIDNRAGGQREGEGTIYQVDRRSHFLQAQNSKH